ncbi:MAG: hypothetical protein OXR68_02835 [Alphaproteobacteria bacterium]|nr:hypothetical protein [Alphaproteobacteria bacterium]
MALLLLVAFPFWLFFWTTIVTMQSAEGKRLQSFFFTLLTTICFQFNLLLCYTGACLAIVFGVLFKDIFSNILQQAHHQTYRSEAILLFLHQIFPPVIGCLAFLGISGLIIFTFNHIIPEWFEENVKWDRVTETIYFCLVPSWKNTGILFVLLLALTGTFFGITHGAENTYGMAQTKSGLILACTLSLLFFCGVTLGEYMERK